MRKVGTKLAFAIGACAGGVVTLSWRPLVKESIKAGIRGGEKLKYAAARGMENLADLSVQARSEFATHNSAPNGSVAASVPHGAAAGEGPADPQASN